MRIKNKKERLIAIIIDELDIEVETSALNTSEIKMLREAKDRLTKLRWEEESKWAQTTKV
jgi:hypothetical protein